MTGREVGVLILDTRFPRIPGDVGHPGTFEFPVLYERIRGASPRRVVRETDPSLLAPFREGARALVRRGAAAITTTCGFLVPFQDALAEAAGVPVLSSSLLLVPLVTRLCGPGRTVGILTIERRSLTPAHLAAAGIGPATPVAVGGMEEAGAGLFARQILDDEPELDVDLCRAEHRAAARRLVAEHPEVAAIVLECANMPPYRADVQAVTGRPVWDLTDLVRLVHAGLSSAPPPYPA
jgi:hypothetical protein